MLKNRRLTGDDNYYAIEQILRMCKSLSLEVPNKSVSRKISRLYYFGFLEKKCFKNIEKYRYARQSNTESFI